MRDDTVDPRDKADGSEQHMVEEQRAMAPPLPTPSPRPSHQQPDRAAAHRQVEPEQRGERPHTQRDPGHDLFRDRYCTATSSPPTCGPAKSIAEPVNCFGEPTPPVIRYARNPATMPVSHRLGRRTTQGPHRRVGAF